MMTDRKCTLQWSGNGKCLTS